MVTNKRPEFPQKSREDKIPDFKRHVVMLSKSNAWHVTGILLLCDCHVTVVWEVPHSRHVGSFPQPTCGKSNNRMIFFTKEKHKHDSWHVRCPRLLSDLGELCPYASQDKQGNVHQTPQAHTSLVNTQVQTTRWSTPEFNNVRNV